MNAHEVLLDIIDDNFRRYHWVFDQIDDECLHWRPDNVANSIAHTMWHVGRVCDVFKTQHIDNRPAGDEVWFSGGWADRTGYDPRGLGVNGWGNIIGYTQEEVDAIPQLSKEDLLAYFDAVINDLKAMLEALPAGGLQNTALGYDGKHDVYTWVKTPLLDLTRHLGEIFALKAMYERQHPVTV